MNNQDDFVQDFARLKQIQMSTDEYEDVWQGAIQRMDSNLSSGKRPRMMRASGLAAGVAAVIVAAGLVTYTVHTSRTTTRTAGVKTNTTTTAAKPFGTVSEPDMLQLLPKQSVLLPQDAKGSRLLPIDLNHDGNREYAAVYQYSAGGVKQVGAIVAANEGGKVKRLWQTKQRIGLVQPAHLSVQHLTSPVRPDLLFEAQVGAMANHYEIAAWTHGRVQSVFSASAKRLDFGDWDASGQAQLLTWTLDTGILYDIQAYGLNGQTGKFEPISNTRIPKYFKQTVIPYYLKLSKTAEGKQSPKMIAYGLAQAYYDAGEYTAARAQVDKGLSLGATAYPPDSSLNTLKQQIAKAEQATKSTR